MMLIAQDQLSLMPKKRIKTSTWYVKFRLAVHNAPDFNIAQHIKQVLDASDQERHIRTLSNVTVFHFLTVQSTDGTFIHANEHLRSATSFRASDFT